MLMELTPEAKKDLRKIAPVEQGRILKKLDAYAAAPSAFRNQVKQLKGEGVLRLRVGAYRIVFTEDGVILRVLRIGHRREVYR